MLPEHANRQKGSEIGSFEGDVKKIVLEKSQEFVHTGQKEGHPKVAEGSGNCKVARKRGPTA
jgi:hypothetical protein